MSTTETPPRAPAHPSADLLAELVHAHQAGVWRFLRTLGCPPATAEELAAETFVVAHQKAFVARGRAEAAAFLRATARFLWLRRQRLSRRERARFADAAEVLWQRDCARDDGDAFVDALRCCLASLDGRAAAAVEYCYRDGLPHAEAAARLGMRPNGLKTLLHRVKAVLRECVLRRLS